MTDLNCFGSSRLIHLQVRAAWVPGQQSCIAYNIETTKLDIITTAITTMALLFIVLVGLFRLRLQDGGTFSIGRLLWTQVGSQRFLGLFTAVLSIFLPFFDF